jgi:hypothetical protein
MSGFIKRLLANHKRAFAFRQFGAADRHVSLPRSGGNPTSTFNPTKRLADTPANMANDEYDVSKSFEVPYNDRDGMILTFGCVVPLQRYSPLSL